MSPRPLFCSRAGVNDDENRPAPTVAALANVRAQPVFFAKVLVNRVWADLIGRGLVDRSTTCVRPIAATPALLDGLADHFPRAVTIKRNCCVDHDEPRLRPVVASEHDATSATCATTRALSPRLRGEVLLDAITDITGVRRCSPRPRLRTRAMELWTVRTQSIFLDSFGRPDPNQDPPCERTSDSSVVQALHLMNSRSCTPR